MIGLFDSGVGGLFALSAMRRLCPAADFLYFGDTHNLPYGGRAPFELLSLGRRAVRFLRGQGAEAVLCACGTVSSLSLPRLRQEFPLPLYGVTEPLAEAAACVARGGRVALLATRATVDCGALSALMKEKGVGEVLPLACPAFVRMAECGCAAIEDVRRVLLPLLSADVQAVVLGCTHFSALSRDIAALFPHATIIDGARVAARAAASALPPHLTCGTGRVTLFTSGETAAFARSARQILGEEWPVLGLL